MRYVEFAPKAERARTNLPARLRLEVNRAIRAIVADPRPSSPIAPDGPRLVAPADSPNAGRITTLVRASGRFYIVTYRVRTAQDTVWILDIREMFMG